MGGGGGGRYIGPWSDTLQQKLDQANQKEKELLDSDVNQLLQNLLVRYNTRNIEEISAKLADVETHLGSEVELDRILLGGSVAKHTAVDGISDVDALVLLDRADLRDKSPSAVLDAFYDILSTKLSPKEVESISKGEMAVTVIYKDETELQLLPALKRGDIVLISAEGGEAWNETNPKAFQRKLTQANKQMNEALVPAIKLLKSINSDLPKQKQLTGYHIEAMAVEGVKQYEEARMPRTLLTHLLGYMADRVLRPIQDPTKQSRVIDSYLGAADSTSRKNVSQTLLGLKRRLDSATNVAQWRSLFEG